MPSSPIQIRCPACSKDNVPITAAPTCQRCGANLGPLRKIHLAATGLRAMAVCALARQDAATALSLAAQSWDLQPHREAACVAALASASLEDMTALLHWRHRAG